jgi:PAS domain S-box-containing protein
MHIKSETVLLCALDVEFADAEKGILADGASFVLNASDLSEALRLISGESPSVVVVGGPSIQSVLDFCKQIRACEGSRRTVVVAVGGERPEDIRTLIDAGADDFVATAKGDGLRSRIIVARRRAADVASHRRTENKLRDMSESLATTFDCMGDGVIATDAEGLVVRMNPVAERLTGWDVVEARGKVLSGILPLINGETRAAVESPFDHARREGVSVALAADTFLLRRDGGEIPIADSCAPIKPDNGTFVGVVLVFRDLTAQRDSESLRAQLQQQLVFADRMVSVGTLAAGMAHEINNPLSYVAANVDLAIEEVGSISGGSSSGRLRELEEILREAREGVARVTKIVRSLKTFSRIEEERTDVIDLRTVVELAINMAFNEIRHRARVVKDYARLPLVDGDDARLGQVFINLLVNAAQAFPEGDTQANEIRIVTSTDPTGRAVVEVRDNGPGIGADLLKQIFDPFFTTKARGTGTGLGLTISHSIVTGMGGEISVKSQLGHGTTFRVTLPASSSSALSAAAFEDKPSKHTGQHATVLVVDDEPAIGLALRRLLRPHDVTVTTSAQDALDLMTAGKEFDVVLSDLMMPGMSGIDLYRSLVKRVPAMVPRVVFLTGGAFTSEANMFLDEIGNERMEKPFDPSKVRELVQRFVR